MGRKKISNEVYTKRLQQLGVLEKIELLEEYRGKNSKILCRCKKCGHEWRTRTDHLTSGNGCPNCRNTYFHKLYVKTHEEFINELKEKGIDNKIEVIGKYINNETKIRVRCKKCGYEWETCLMIDREKYCPVCGAPAPVEKTSSLRGRLNNL